MIIRNIEIVKKDSWALLQATITWRNECTPEVFCAVPDKYARYLDASLADPFVIAFVMIAAKYNEDIVVEGANVSEQLKQRIEDILMPKLQKMGCGNGNSKILSSVAETNHRETSQIGATGISLGVDSFYSILTNLNKNNANKPIGAVVYIDPLAKWSDYNDENLKNILKPRTEVAEELKLKLIPILTNFRFVLEKEFAFEQIHTYCNIGTIVCLKNLISYYYYASGFSDSQMKLDLHGSALYDNVLQQVFSYDGFIMYSSGGNVTRYEKTEYIAKEKAVQKHLDVCLHDQGERAGYVNCTICPKCRRTMTTLDVMGKLSLFGQVFDLNYYYRNKAKSWADMEYRRIIGKDPYATEIYTQAKQNGYRIPRIKWFYIIKTGVRNQINKIGRKHG